MSWKLTGGQGLLAQLPDNYRTVLVLSEMEGMNDAQIADVPGVSHETVKIRLHRARARLKAGLEANCRFYRNPENKLPCDSKRRPRFDGWHEGVIQFTERPFAEHRETRVD